RSLVVGQSHERLGGRSGGLDRHGDVAVVLGELGARGLELRRAQQPDGSAATTAAASATEGPLALHRQRDEHQPHRRKRRAYPSHGWRLREGYSGMSAAVSVTS